jgi:hypothetical protein
MGNYVWSIVIISAGIISPVIQNVGTFKDEAACKSSLADLKSQLPIAFKTFCVQYPEPPAKPTPPPPAPPPAPSVSFGSKDARK